jgi:hypothetical protein
MALGGGRQGVYGNGQQEIAHRGWSKYGKQDKIRQPVNQRGLYVLVKEAVVPKEFKTSKEEDVAVGPQGCCYVQTWQFRVFILLRWLIGFFLPLTAGFFFM